MKFSKILLLLRFYGLLFTENNGRLAPKGRTSNRMLLLTNVYNNRQLWTTLNTYYLQLIVTIKLPQGHEANPCHKLPLDAAKDMASFVVLNSTNLSILHTNGLNVLLGFTTMIIPILRIDSDVSDRMDFNAFCHDFNID